MKYVFKAALEEFFEECKSMKIILHLLGVQDIRRNASPRIQLQILVLNKSVTKFDFLLLNRVHLKTSVNFPTGPFTVLWPQDQEIGKFYVVQEVIVAYDHAPTMYRTSQKSNVKNVQWREFQSLSFDENGRLKFGVLSLSFGQMATS